MHTEQTQTKRRHRSHPFSERKRVVELYESGLSSKRIAQALDLDDSMVRLWLRLYRAKGLEALRPYYRAGKSVRSSGVRVERRKLNERLFTPALEVYSTTLESVASIARRYGLDYQSFVYHLKTFHPELTAKRGKLVMSMAFPVDATLQNGETREKEKVQ